MQSYAVCMIASGCSCSKSAAKSLLLVAIRDSLVPFRPSGVLHSDHIAGQHTMRICQHYDLTTRPIPNVSVAGREGEKVTPQTGRFPLHFSPRCDWRNSPCSTDESRRI